MWTSRKHGLCALALAPLFALAPGLATTSASASAISLEVPHALGIQIQVPPLPIEVTLPKVEVPGVLKVETSSPQSGEAPTAPVVKVEVPALPPVSASPEVPSTPTTGTPIPELPKVSASSGDAPAGAQKQATEASATVATGASAQATPTGTSDPASSSSTAGASTTTARAVRGKARHAAGGSAVGGRGSRALAATGTQSGSGTSHAPAAASSDPRASAPHEDSSGNPLNSIGRQIPFPLPVPDWSKPIILLLLVLAIFFGARSQLAAVRARRLERQRAELLSDLGVMQATLVPVIPERLGGLTVSVAYSPADGPAAGGDFYDLFTLGPDKVAIVLGDVAGHGRGALMQAALTRYTLRAYLQAGLEPRAALALAGSVLAEPGDKQFATVVVAVHDSAEGTLTYASAGHPPPIAIGFDTPEPLTICCSAPLCCDLPTGRRQTTIPLPANGSLCFFSDGLLEARVEHGELLGRERLDELVSGPGAPQTSSALLERVREVAQTTPDDMVACIVSPATRTPTRNDTVEELEVDAQTIDTPRVRLFLETCGLSTPAIATLLAQAGAIVDADGAALLWIERPHTGEPRAIARAGLSTPAWAGAGDVGGDPQGPPLTLPASR
jgi:hypothetical protein